ncbi:hypothetical protein [Methylobacterium sp. Leaf85]|uniref:hypothetical protein n=1 Tax=Methylobacterium sp. Leaf85 TaxID=1736241 RepID=UPI0006FE6058|nr:hypothetical protein [Methylobacterium sp. Leaf85]KQO43005.1 hypothetical protein ASF08_10530 [Methylobacterium sp. Leaf85]
MTALSVGEMSSTDAVAYLAGSGFPHVVSVRLEVATASYGRALEIWQCLSGRDGCDCIHDGDRGICIVGFADPDAAFEFKMRFG